MKKTKTFLSLVMTILFGISLAAQDPQLVSGTVHDTNDQPVPGAFVKVVGTTNGTSTSSEGYFAIQAKQGDKLEISCLGYQTQIVNVGGGV